MKVLASDFDGTLLLHPAKNKDLILTADKEAIKKFQQAGNLFGICTGRDLRGVVDFSQDIVYDFYILNSGAIILNGKQEIIQAHYLDLELIKEIIAYFPEKICCTFVQKGKMYVINSHQGFYD